MGVTIFSSNSHSTTTKKKEVNRNLFFSTTSSPYNLSIIQFSLKLSLDLKRIWVDLFFYMAKKVFLIFIAG